MPVGYTPVRSRKFDERDRAVLDVLLEQYRSLRDEITQSIYLEHFAILGLYTSLGLICALLVGDKTNFKGIIEISLTNPNFLFALVIIQVIISSFGSLFLKEQARNRRACSFLKAIEHLINEKIGEIGIYWENYITSELIAKKISVIEYINFNIPVNRQYYKNRLLGVGLPVFLPNILITFAIGQELFPSSSERILLLSILVIGIIFCMYYRKDKLNTNDRKNLTSLRIFMLIIASIILLCLKKTDLLLTMIFVFSILITFLWALMIIYKSGFPLKEESVPDKQKVLKWLENEQLKILFRSMPSVFTIKDNVVELEIHVINKDYSGVIYDVEIFPEDQDPPWECVKCVGSDRGPENWVCKEEGNGVKFITRSDPLRRCKPVKFKFNVRLLKKSIKSIRVHLTDKNGDNIGEIISKLSISTFTIKNGEVKIEVHNIRDEFTENTFCIEIFPEDQDPPWESIECVGNDRTPRNWKCKKTKNGVRFFTESYPLIEWEPSEFKFRIQYGELPSYIRLHFKDKNKNLIGEIISIPK